MVPWTSLQFPMASSSNYLTKVILQQPFFFDFVQHKCIHAPALVTQDSRLRRSGQVPWRYVRELLGLGNTTRKQRISHPPLTEDSLYGHPMMCL
ncbi:hypothetical protein BS50DRAFT_68414 [Corynespora cassiicola Philippines]|uniref:Uncharacterized protein n=1 Tax=Corynespora cassiicola Philippines TaxID=1448308 RepID=A0A2T2NG79_CORCC|nr:hypothetical protein BS50DRAFT_68414 [Corynespora cassiicola Philippines]